MGFEDFCGGQNALSNNAVYKGLARPSTGLNQTVNVAARQQGLGGYQNINSGYGYTQTGLNRNAYNTGSCYSNFQQRNIAPPVRPYVIRITNNSPSSKPFVLLGASNNRTHYNFGNMDEIVIEYAIDDMSYMRLLAQTEAYGISMKRIRIECLDNNRKNLENGLTVKKWDAYGKVIISPLSSYMPSNIFTDFACEYPCDAEVDSCTEFKGTLEAYSSIRLSLFPDRNRSYGLAGDAIAGMEQRRAKALKEAEYQRLKHYLLIVD